MVLGISQNELRAQDFLPTYLVLEWGLSMSAVDWEAQLVAYDANWANPAIYYTFKYGMRQPDISADGRYILFVAQDDTTGADIFLRSVVDGSYLDFPNSVGDDITPRFSCDGNSVYFASNRSGNFDIYCWNMVTGELADLTNSPEDEISPCPYPKGEILVASRYADGCWQLVEFIIEKKFVNPLTTKRMGNCTGPVFSPDGHKLAFEGPAEIGSDIYIANFEGANLVGWRNVVTEESGSIIVHWLNNIHPLDTTPGRDLYPCFSADGEKVYFGSNRQGFWQVYGITIDGGPAEPVMEINTDVIKGIYMPTSSAR